MVRLATTITTALLALAASPVLAAHHAQNRRAVGSHQNVHRAHVARRASAKPAERHEYIRSNSTLAARSAERRGSQGQATFYHPATEGGSQSSCGPYLNDNSKVVALSQAGWDYFASQGISQQELCNKKITIQGPLGTQQATILDTCPPDSSTGTCGNICDIDLVYGLFGELENYAAGIFNVHWSFTDGTASPCGSSSSSPSSSSASHTYKSAIQQATSTSQSAAATPSSSSSASSSGSSFSTTLQWWDDIDSQWCPGVSVPSGTITAAVGPTSKYSNENLSDTCGKTISIEADGKKTQALVVEWVPGSQQNLLAVGSSYNDIVGSGSGAVTWSFN